MLFASRGRKVGPAIFDRRHRRLTQGLIGYWSASLTGPTGLQLLDLSGSNNNGTLTNMDAPTDWVTERYGYAIDFDGVNDSVRITNQTVLNPVGPMSIAAWVNYTLGQGNRGILVKWGDFGQYGLFCDNNFNTRLAFRILSAGATQSAVTARSYNDGQWHLMVGVYDRQNVTINMNGGSEVVVGSAVSTDITTTTQGLWFGSWTNGGAPFQGRIAAGYLWNRAITFSETAELFRLGPGGLGHPERISVGIFEAFIAYSMLADSRSYSLSGLPIPLLYGRAIPADTASVLLQGQTTHLLVSRLLGADRGTYDVSGFDAGLLLGRLLDAGAAAYMVNGTSSKLVATRRISADSVAYLASGQDAAFLRSRVIQAGTGQYILVASPIDIQTGTGGAAPYYYLFLLGGSR